MRVLSGVLLEACFVLGLLSIVVLIVLLRHFVWRFAQQQGRVSDSWVVPGTGFGRSEQLKRPAFLPGTDGLSMRRW